MAKKLTQADMDLYLGLLRYAQKYSGNTPTAKWIMEHTAHVTTSTINYSIAKMQSLGLLQVVSGPNEAYKIVLTGGIYIYKEPKFLAELDPRQLKLEV